VSILQFVREQLNAPGVALPEVVKSTGISLRSLQMIRAGDLDNAWTANVERLAAHFGYRFEPVLISPPRRRSTDVDKAKAS
jgi:hypothetical protein